jgi:hypothetical protein
MKPTIAFFGSSLVSAHGNGAAAYYRGIIRALFGLGYDVTFYEPDAGNRQQHRDIDDPGWARGIVYPADETASEDGVRCALQHARSADIIVKTSGVAAFDAWLDEAVLDARAPHAQAIYWDVDAPATLERLAANPSDPFRALVPRYNLILTHGGGAPVVRAYEAGVRGSACRSAARSIRPRTIRCRRTRGSRRISDFSAIGCPIASLASIRSSSRRRGNHLTPGFCSAAADGRTSRCPPTSPMSATCPDAITTHLTARPAPC